MFDKSIAHKHDMNMFGAQEWPDGLVPWEDATPPNLTGKYREKTTGQLRHCAYCGSLHPADVAAAIRAGARGEWADRKYGWPHKAYFENIPNPHAGLLESRSARTWPPDPGEEDKWRKVQSSFNQSTGEPEYMWWEVGKPAAPTTGGKFYSVHLQDATPADRATIESHLGLMFEFSDDGQSVKWTHVGVDRPSVEDDGHKP